MQCSATLTDALRFRCLIDVKIYGFLWNLPVDTNEYFELKFWLWARGQ